MRRRGRRSLFDSLLVKARRANYLSPMRMDYISGLPYSEIADALGATPHSRHMMGALLAFCPYIEGESVLARACMSPEFAKSAATCQQDGIVQELIAHGALPAKRVQEYAEKAFVWRMDDDEQPNKIRTALLALGSPLLTKLHEFHERISDGCHDIVKDAFWGNPLVHRNDRSSTAVSRGGRFFIQNAATFGNLENPMIRAAVTARVGMDGDSGVRWGADADNIYLALCSRDDLPNEVVAALHKTSQSTPKLHRRLVENPVHRRLVRDEVHDPIKFFAFCEEPPYQGREGIAVISPECSISELEKEWNFGVLNGSRQASLLLAANCPEVYYQTAKEAGEKTLDSYLFARHSPWAKEHFASVDAEFLRNITGVSSLSWACLPAIPFERFDPPDMQRVFFVGCDVDLGHIVGAIRTRGFAEKLSYSDTEIADFAQLFSPHTSGRRLDEFTRKSPELAGFAACHPNGADIPLSAVLSEHREVVEAIRAPVLGGRGVAGGNAGRQALVI